MNCKICKNPFFLPNKPPTNPCCINGICHKCYLEVIKDPQNGVLDCTICKEKTKVEKNFKVNKADKS